MSFLKILEETIQSRKKSPKPNSYTSKLFQNGLDRILKKIGEEAGEVIIAAKNKSTDELKYESADLVFHLLVLLHHKGLCWDDVVNVLEKRRKWG